MRSYVKPVMQVERFVAKNAVASGCYEATNTTFPAQTVNCIINGNESIFNKSQSGSTCQYDATTSGTLAYYEGGTYTYNRKTYTLDAGYYFVWKNGSVSGQPSGEATAKLSAIESALGVTSAIGKSGWHAGTVTYEQYTAMNHTS